MKTAKTATALALAFSLHALAQDTNVPQAAKPAARTSRLSFQGSSSGSNPDSAPPTPSATTPPAGGAQPGAANVLPAGAATPDLTPIDDLRKPGIVLPTEPLDPYLIQKENGPFMVMAYTFVGPDAARFAQALTMEMRTRYQYPAYIFFAKVHPGHSNIYNIPPTARPPVHNGEMAAPEKYRNYDEAAVLVGNCASVEDAKQLQHKIKKLRPATLEKLPSIYAWRRGQGLARCFITANPLAPSQYLYGGREMPIVQQGQTFDPSVVTSSFAQARKPDPLLKRINTGPHSIYKCNGPFVLQVAEFTGRGSANPKDPRFQNDKELAKSPLAAAGEEAEKLADSLGKCKYLKKNIRPYVYHERASSRVFVGPFRSGEDPELVAFLTPTNLPGLNFGSGKNALRPFDAVAMELLAKKYTSTVIFPAGALTPVPKD